MRKKLATILPDIDGHDVMPHPDNLAWRKACGECAHRTSDPQALGIYYQRRMMEFDGSSVFYCVHRHDVDYDRICACYAAVNKIEAI